MHFTFALPWLLPLLLALPCFWLCRETPRRFYHAKPEWFGRSASLFRLDPLWLALVYFFIVIAAAEPFYYTQTASSDRKGRNLVLALDASGSMAQSGYDAKDRMRSKFDTLLELADSFVSHRSDDTIGIIIFGTFAYAAVPLTYDLKAVRYLLHTLDVGIAGESTAIGDALMRSLETLRYGKAEHKVIVLFTDGKHNAGSHSPKEAVEAAKKAHVRIYTVGIGERKDFDESLLEKIAKETGGKSFAARNAEDLETVLETIDALEPSKVRAPIYLGKVSVQGAAVLLALALLSWRYVREVRYA